ncbi:MAG: hypothetical protein H0V07_02360 [Propionibacteriales bacterium]|nr:hypothetical protein [Propionibacteriales bacterium]
MTNRRLLNSSWPPMIGALLGVVGILSYHDAPILGLGKFVAYLSLAVALPGIFAWRLLLAHLHQLPDGSDESTEDNGSPTGSPTWFEDLSLGTIFGFGIQLPVYLIGIWINVPLLFLMLPVIAVGLSVATPLGRAVWVRPTAKVDVRVSWALAALIVYAVAWLARYLFYLRPLSLAANHTPSVDETFHQALISELLHRFPPQIPFLLDTRLDYHWFAHAQMATDHWATQLSTQLLLRQLMPTAVIALTILGLGAVSLRLSGRPVAAVIAPALLVAGGFSLMGPHFDAGMITEPYMSRRFISSPSQAYGFMMALPPIMLILEVLRPDRKASRLTWVTLAVALFALSGSKATFMPIFLCGAIALGLVRLVVGRTFDRTVAALAALLLVVTIFAQVVLFGGSSGAMAFNPFMTVERSLASQGIEVSATSMTVMTVTLLVGWLLYGVGAVGLVKQGLWRDPRALWMLFSIPAGIGVAFIFFRSGASQLWFQRSVAELVVLLSAWGLVQLLPNPLTTRRALPLAGVAATAGLGAFVVSSQFESGLKDITRATYHEIIATALTPFLVLAAYLLTRGVTKAFWARAQPGPAVVLAFLLGLGLSHPYSLIYDTVTRRAVPHPSPRAQFAPGGVAAATWIANHSDRYDIVATNVHCRVPRARRCDNRNFWVAAYTERRIVIEGWGYTATTNSGYSEGEANAYIPNPDPERLKINDEPLRHPSAQTVGRLVNSYDVKYLFVSKQYPADIPGLNELQGLLVKKFHNDHYAVFKVLDR